MSPFNANHLHLSDKLDLFLCDLEMFVYNKIIFYHRLL